MVAAAKGVLLVPSFAIGRTQEVVWQLDRLIERGEIPLLPLYLDSPMASKASDIYRHHPDDYDEETAKLLREGASPLDYPNQIVTNDASDSKAIARAPRPYLIVASNGMLTGGRVVSHLRNLIDDPSATILFVGYQGEGTLGAHLQAGAREVKLDGQVRAVHCQVRSISGFSAHADESELLDWLGHFAAGKRPGDRAIHVGSSWSTAIPRPRSPSSRRCAISASPRTSALARAGHPRLIRRNGADTSRRRGPRPLARSERTHDAARCNGGAHQAQRGRALESHAGPSTGGRHEGAWMRPSLNILSDELIARIVDEAKRVLAEVGMEIRGPEDAPAPARSRAPPERLGRAGALPPRHRGASDRRCARLVHPVRPRRRTACRHRRRSRAFRARLIGPQGARPPDRRDAPRQLDRLRRVRPAGRRPGQHPVPRHGLLDQRRHRGPGVRRLAPLHDPDELEQAGRLGRVHRARRPAHGRDDAAVPARPGRPDRPPDVDLHDHRDRQLPVQRGLLPEPDRLRRGRASRSRSCRSP